MPRVRFWANLLLVGFSALVLVHSTGTINGAGAGVRIVYLESEGILDRAKACEVNSEWCDPEKLGRFIASHYFSVEALIALVAIFVAILNLSGLLKPSETRYAEDSLEDQVDLREN